MSAMNVNIIGSGNVAYWLSKGISSLGHRVTIVTRKDANEISERFDLSAQPNITANADVVLICAPDDAIETIAAGTPESATVLHTSGATSIDILSQFESYGVLYPMQTLSIDKVVDLAQLPIGIEGNTEHVNTQLAELTGFSSGVIPLNSDQRLKFHLAAVFVNNFGNQMLEIAYDLASSGGLDPEILYPLMRETTDKALAIGPTKAQTGPASRGDMKTIEKHLSLLSKHPEYKEIYEVLTKEIKRKHDHH